MCEYGFLAARARSTENAAIAKSSVPPRGGKTGHSCKAQQDKSVELTDCGQRVNSLQLRQRLVSALSHIRRNVSLETTGGFLSSAAAATIIAFGTFDCTPRNQHSPYF